MDGGGRWRRDDDGMDDDGMDWWRGEGGGGRCMRDDSGSGDGRWLVDRCVGENAYGILGQDPDVFEGT